MVAQAGYDAVTRTFYIPAGTMYGFSVPERPTVDEVDRARSLIEDALGEFPFVDEASRANAFALLLRQKYGRQFWETSRWRLQMPHKQGAVRLSLFPSLQRRPAGTTSCLVVICRGDATGSDWTLTAQSPGATGISDIRI